MHRQTPRPHSYYSGPFLPTSKHGCGMYFRQEPVARPPARSPPPALRRGVSGLSLSHLAGDQASLPTCGPLRPPPASFPTPSSCIGPHGFGPAHAVCQFCTGGRNRLSALHHLASSGLVPDKPARARGSPFPSPAAPGTDTCLCVGGLRAAEATHVAHIHRILSPPSAHAPQVPGTSSPSPWSHSIFLPPRTQGSTTKRSLTCTYQRVAMMLSCSLGLASAPAPALAPALHAAHRVALRTLSHEPQPSLDCRSDRGTAIRVSRPSGKGPFGNLLEKPDTSQKAPGAAAGPAAGLCLPPWPSWRPCQ